MTVYCLNWISNKTPESGGVNNMIIRVITLLISTNQSKVFNQVSPLLQHGFLSSAVRSSSAGYCTEPAYSPNK